MKLKLTLLIAFIATISFVSCSNKSDIRMPKTSTDNIKLKGDHTVYGLACEGCTDSVVVLLPVDGKDPVQYNCLNAHRKGKILGKLKIGDWIAVVPSPDNKKVADIVIDLDDLKGIWCYIVMPKLKDYENMSMKLQNRLMKELPDSIKETYMIPREYGFWMKRQWICQSVGYVASQNSLEDESPVVYPPLGYFTGWRIWNGKLIISSGTPNILKDNTIEISNVRYDTCNIDYLKDDSLVLSSDGVSRSYYRKNSVEELNKKAKAMAAKLSQKAMDDAKDN